MTTIVEKSKKSRGKNRGVLLEGAYYTIKPSVIISFQSRL